MTIINIVKSLWSGLLEIYLDIKSKALCLNTLRACLCVLFSFISFFTLFTQVNDMIDITGWRGEPGSSSHTGVLDESSLLIAVKSGDSARQKIRNGFYSLKRTTSSTVTSSRLPASLHILTSSISIAPSTSLKRYKHAC